MPDPALGRHDAGRVALRRRHGADQLGPAAGRADRLRDAVLVPPPARLGRGAARVSGSRRSSIRCSCSDRCCSCSVCAAAGCGTSVTRWPPSSSPGCVVNLPALWLAPDAWRASGPSTPTATGDLGSIWYVLVAGQTPGAAPEPGQRRAVRSRLPASIALLILFAPRRPRFGAVAFLVIVAFLLTNKVYSPQYVLWLLPFVVLARPALAGLADLHRRRADLLRARSGGTSAACSRRGQPVRTGSTGSP